MRGVLDGLSSLVTLHDVIVKPVTGDILSQWLFHKFNGCCRLSSIYTVFGLRTGRWSVLKSDNPWGTAGDLRSNIIKWGSPMTHQYSALGKDLVRFWDQHRSKYYMYCLILGRLYTHHCSKLPSTVIVQILNSAVHEILHKTRLSSYRWTLIRNSACWLYLLKHSYRRYTSITFIVKCQGIWLW